MSGDRPLRAIDSNDLGWWDIDGVTWHKAPLPRRWHRCSTWTRGYLMGQIDRCACGAVRYGGSGSWFDRNSTRKAIKKYGAEAALVAGHWSGGRG